MFPKDPREQSILISPARPITIDVEAGASPRLAQTNPLESTKGFQTHEQAWGRFDPTERCQICKEENRPVDRPRSDKTFRISPLSDIHHRPLRILTYRTQTGLS